MTTYNTSLWHITYFNYISPQSEIHQVVMITSWLRHYYPNCPTQDAYPRRVRAADKRLSRALLSYMSQVLTKSMRCTTSSVAAPPFRRRYQLRISLRHSLLSIDSLPVDTTSTSVGASSQSAAGAGNERAHFRDNILPADVEAFELVHNTELGHCGIDITWARLLKADHPLSNGLIRLLISTCPVCLITLLLGNPPVEHLHALSHLLPVDDKNISGRAREREDLLRTLWATTAKFQDEKAINRAVEEFQPSPKDPSLVHSL